MQKETIIKLLKELKENSKKRNFKQSYDLIVNVKNINLKNADEHIDFFVTLHYSKGKKAKVCGLVGPELKDDAVGIFDKTIAQSDFEVFAKDKAAVKKLADDHDFFVAQANIMPQVATVFGKVLGPRKKMPNPKAGCIVPPKTALKPLYEKLQKTVRIMVKESPIVQITVGNEDMKDEEVIDNILTVYDQIIHHLPNEKNNIKKIFLKLTMSKPVNVDF